MHEPEEIHLRDYIAVLRKRKKTAIIFFLITFTTVCISTLAAPRLFMASTNLLIEKIAQKERFNSSAYGTNDPEFFETQVELIKSFNVAKRVVNTLKLDAENSGFFNEKSATQKFIEEKKTELLTPLLELLKSSPDAASQADSNHANDGLGLYRDNPTPADRIANTIREGITVTPIKGSRVVAISYLHQNPVIAQMIVNTTAKSYMDEILEISTSNSSYAVKWMSQKAQGERERLEASEKILNEYSKKANIVTIENKVTLLPEKLNMLGSKLADATAKRDLLADVTKTIRENANNPEKIESIPALAANSLLQDLSGKIIAAETKYNDLSKSFGPKHPEIQSALQSIDKLKGERKRELQKQIGSLESEYQLAQAQVRTLEASMESTKGQAQKLNDDSIQYNILKRDVETNRTLYDALLGQMKDKQVSEDSRNITVWVTAPAKTPQRPAKPNIPRNLLLGLILGAFAGIGMAFFIDYLDNTVHLPDELEKVLGLSVLGCIDRLIVKGSVSPTDNWDPSQDYSTPFSESIKAIRTAIMLSAAEAPPKKIMVTSCLPQEGKSTTTINVARAFAHADYKVLIIDADLRKPRIHKVFQVNNDLGLSTYLAGLDPAGTVKQAFGEKNIHILPAGPIPPNPSELFTSDRFSKLLAKLEEEFDFIFVDTAPLFAATETLFISKVTRPILVAKSGATTRNQLADGIQTLREAGANPLGAVLNGLDRKKVGYGYGGYYKQYGYYTATAKDAA